MLYSTLLYYSILYYTILYYTVLHYTTLYYTILYYTILYYEARPVLCGLRRRGAGLNDGKLESSSLLRENLSTSTEIGRSATFGPVPAEIDQEGMIYL